MTVAADPPDAAVPCHQCGYDVRSQPADGVCPECGASVAESIRLAVIPLRPAWRDSDPRWRRRILAGLWVLVLMPLPYALPNLSPAYEPYGPYGLVDLANDFRDSLASMVWPLIVTLIGLVLLFEPERAERPRPAMRRLRLAGVAGCWLSVPVAIVSLAGVTLLVGAGMWAMLSPVDKSRYTPFAVALNRTWSQWAYFGGMALHVGLAVLAGIVLADALRRAGSRRARAALIWLGGLLMAVQAGLILLASLGVGQSASWVYFEFLFSPIYLAEGWRECVAAVFGPGPAGYGDYDPNPPETAEDWIALFARFPLEFAKWLLLLTVAARLTAAQRGTWLHARRREPTLP